MSKLTTKALKNLKADAVSAEKKGVASKATKKKAGAKPNKVIKKKSPKKKAK